MQLMDQNSKVLLCKLDGVGPVDNRPCPNYLHPFVPFLKGYIYI